MQLWFHAAATSKNLMLMFKLKLNKALIPYLISVVVEEKGKFRKLNFTVGGLFSKDVGFSVQDKDGFVIICNYVWWE